MSICVPYYKIEINIRIHMTSIMRKGTFEQSEKVQIHTNNRALDMTVSADQLFLTLVY